MQIHELATVTTSAASDDYLVLDGVTYDTRRILVSDFIAGLGGGGGSGTVTTVSVATANGISGTVATATSTPVITLSLGAITPTSVTSTMSGATNPVILSSVSDATTYGLITFNNALTVAGSLGISAGASGDSRLYLRVPTGGTINLRVNDTLVGEFTSTGLNSSAVGASTPSTGAFTTLTTTGAITAGSGGTGTASTSYLSLNGASGSDSGAYVAFKKNGTVKGYVGNSSAIIGGTSDELMLHTISLGLVVQDNSGQYGSWSRSSGLSVTGSVMATSTFIGPAATTSIASLRLPHGTAPSAPTDGDMWTTSAGGLYVRINGATVGPLGTGAGSGDVTAASSFGTDNVLVRSDGTGKGVQSTGISVDDSNNMTGVGTLTTTTASATTFKILDSVDQSHGMSIVVGSNLTADRNFTITTGDAARTITVFGDTTVPVFSQQITFSGPTAARTITLPDAAFTVARTDAANTFVGTQTLSSTTSLLLGTAGSAVGNIGFRNATSGTATLAPPTGALGTYTVTLPNAASTLPIFGQQITFAGPTAARTVTMPDAAFTVARTDAANTFTGTQTIGALVATTFNGNTFTTGTGVLTIAASKTLTVSNTLTLAGTDSTTMTFPAASATVAGLGTTQTFTGIQTFSPTARSSGAAAYLVITTPADTAQTASTESIGVSKTAATRQWSTGALTTQREVVFAAPTYAFVGSSTLTTAINVDIADPVQGTNATLTNIYSLRAANVLFTGVIKAGSTPTTLTDSAGKILSAALNTVAVANGGTGATTVAGIWTGSTIATTVISASAIDWALGPQFSKTLAANTTFTFSNATDGQCILVILTNTASNYTVTWPTVIWSGGAAPTMTVGAKTDAYTFSKFGSIIIGSAVQNCS